MSLNFQDIWNTFATHYDKRLNNQAGKQYPLQDLAPWKGYYYHHNALRPGNGPRILYHEQYTDDVIVLAHGLTDSPYYLQTIAGRFFEEGCNVVMPLLPAHGQLQRKSDMNDEELSEHWQDTIDHAVEVAQLLGERISVGGFSTGGVLSVNKVLRDGDQIKGGIFLFSAAISIGRTVDALGNFEIVERIIDIFFDSGDITEDSPDPYKYPCLPKATASEVVEIIKDNKERLGKAHKCSGPEDRRLVNPVFAAHSLHDQTADFHGVSDFLRDHVRTSMLYPICDCVQHSSVPLKEDVPLDLSILDAYEKDPEKLEARKAEWVFHTVANPHFEDMIVAMIQFFREKVRNN